MNTIHIRRQAVRAAFVSVAAVTMQRSQKMLIVLTLAVGAILVALSVPAAHAGPGEGPGSENPNPTPPKVLQVHASENPVIFQPWETTKTITFTWNPEPNVPAAVKVFEDGQFLWIKSVAPGEQGPLDLTVTYGKTYTVQLISVTYNVGPLLTITTEKPVTYGTFPQAPPSTVSPPGITISPTLTPNWPGLE
jgi:hypothetical protein